MWHNTENTGKNMAKFVISTCFRRKPFILSGVNSHYQNPNGVLRCLNGTENWKGKNPARKGIPVFIGKDGYVWAAPMKHNKTGKKKKVGTEKIAKEKGYMYYIGKDGFVAKAKMKNA